MVMLWCTVIWSIWRHRNSLIFENGALNLHGLVEEINATSWKWWIARSNSTPCLLYEWIAEPGVCLTYWGTPADCFSLCGIFSMYFLFPATFHLCFCRQQYLALYMALVLFLFSLHFLCLDLLLIKFCCYKKKSIS
jgi:hypothetical protein